MSGWVAGASVVSAGIGAYSSHQQTKAAQKTMKDPLAKDRRGYADQLQTMQDDPASFYQNPLYQNAFGQGQQAVRRGMAAEGFTGSGNFATGLQKFGQSFGMDMFMEYSKYLAEIAGFSHFPDQGAGLAGLDAGASRMNDALGQLGGTVGRFFGSGGGGMPMPASINTPYNPGFSTPTYSGPMPSLPAGTPGLTG